MIKVFRIFFIFLVITLCFFAFLNPAKTETNILRAIFPENQNSEMIINLSRHLKTVKNFLLNFLVKLMGNFLVLKKSIMLKALNSMKNIIETFFQKIQEIFLSIRTMKQ